jgi:hypothetical protein
MATLLGMALGGWMLGRDLRLTGSYRAAFLNGIALQPAQPDDLPSSCCRRSLLPNRPPSSGLESPGRREPP